jgi:hypothetical protein
MQVRSAQCAQQAWAKGCDGEDYAKGKKRNEHGRVGLLLHRMVGLHFQTAPIRPPDVATRAGDSHAARTILAKPVNPNSQRSEGCAAVAWPAAKESSTPRPTAAANARAASTRSVKAAVDDEAEWGYAETSQEHSLSSSNWLSHRKGLSLRIGLARLEAVVEAAEEAVEQVALCSGVSIAGHAAPVVVSSGTG